MDFCQRVNQFIHRKWVWIWSRPWIWFSAFFIVAIFWVIQSPGTTDLRIRLLALAFQLIGTILAVVDLLGHARDNGYPGVWKSFANYVREGIFGRHLVVSAGFASLTVGAGSAHSAQRVTVLPSASLAERVTALEQNQKFVDNDLQDARQQQFKAEQGFKNLLQKEARARQDALDSLGLRTKEAVLRSFPTLVFGAVWIAVGTILSAVAPEIHLAVTGHLSEIRHRF